MKLKAQNVLLFIETENKISDKPIVDDLTIAMYNSLRRHIDTGLVVKRNNICSFARGLYTDGYYVCSCGVCSADHDYAVKLNDGSLIYTNGLAAHYLAYHRQEVPNSELEKVKNLAKTLDIVIPTEADLMDNSYFESIPDGPPVDYSC